MNSLKAVLCLFRAPSVIPDAAGVFKREKGSQSPELAAPLPKEDEVETVFMSPPLSDYKNPVNNNFPLGLAGGQVGYVRILT